MTKKQVQLYKKTHYVFKAQKTTLIVKIGKHSADLVKFLKKNKIETFAIITAWNPKGVSTDIINTAKNTELAKILRNYDLKFKNGCGIGDDIRWAPEHSYFIENISLEFAEELSRQFKQNAYVFGTPHKALLKF